MAIEKPVIWVRSSLEELKALPQKPRRDIGFALAEVQEGGFPDNAKLLKGFSGVYEIRTDFDSNTYRAAYVVNLGENIYVLHVFQKKSKRGAETPKADLEKIRGRLKRAQELAKELENDNP